ncbi:uncharacterized protein LOC103700742 isoform X2 [Phoenix dactylifera]|uniref:Uncharacterized protein LOC103700742 isoform X2 n=1 Tax=Phoenix dactylifera TaxID=42345 RepID=A0A8B9AUQ4_PHODC|nr:uncharacterized protein LOC103700742 isoform X2 [Phoenix dactylifera]
MERGASRARQNAMRSGLVVVGAIAFGYLSFQVGFKPFLDRAQEAMEITLPVDREAGQQEERRSPPSDTTISFSQDEEDLGRLSRNTASVN